MLRRENGGGKGYLAHIGVNIGEELAKCIEKLVEVLENAGLCRLRDIVESLARIVAHLVVVVSETLQHGVQKQRKEINCSRIESDCDGSNGSERAAAIARIRRAQVVRLQLVQHFLHLVHIAILLDMTICSWNRHKTG